MEALSKGYVRRAEPPEPLDEIDGGYKRKREESQPPQELDDKEGEDVVETSCLVSPKGDYETEFTRTVSIEERQAKADVGNYTVMNLRLGDPN